MLRPAAAESLGVNWELSAAPYLPIHRRRLWRRRIAIIAVALVIGVPSYLYYRHVSQESLGRRVFDDVESSVAAAYYDPSYHGVAWPAVAARFRPLVENARDSAARYSALRQMLSALGDSHTMAFSPLEVDGVERRPDVGVSGAIVGPLSGRRVVVAVAPRSPASDARASYAALPPSTRRTIRRGETAGRVSPRGV